MAGHVFAQNMLECLIIKMVTEKVLNLFSFVAMSEASELGIMICITPRVTVLGFNVLSYGHFQCSVHRVLYV